MAAPPPSAGGWDAYGSASFDEDDALVFETSYYQQQERALYSMQERRQDDLALEEAIRASIIDADRQYPKELEQKQERDLEQNRQDQEYRDVLRTSQALHDNQVQWDHSNRLIQERSREQQMGAWDCVKCTFRNPPYTAKCKVCEAEAPEQVLSFRPLPSVNFRVELEIVIPDGKRDGFTLLSALRRTQSLIREAIDAISAHISFLLIIPGGYASPTPRV